ncbi:hypothetical protein B6Q27_14175 [Escherichia coli]|nr:hypothetical protein [Escherichia coli]EFO2680095.1 hypothetical protein [Escherichia coli]
MLIFLAGFFRTIKKRSFTRRYSKRSNILWPTTIKSSVKISLVSLSDLIAAISNYSFCDPQHKMLFVAYEGRRIYGKRLHSQNDVLSEEKKLTLINCSR